MISGLRKIFDKKGYVVLPSSFSEQEINGVLEEIQERLKKCAQDLSCSYKEYLKVASRWVAPSPLTKGLENIFMEPLKELLETFIEEPQLIKMNLISKTPYAPWATPFHQDMSYSLKDPYELSIWLALTDVPIGSGPLSVWEESHNHITTAVDFWSPDFIQEDVSKHPKFKELPVSKGDMIIFDSKLWHGSCKNKTSYERFAFVTRWKSKKYIAPEIPPIVPKPFGMWTCQKETEKILKEEGLFFSKDQDLDYISLLNKWIRYLETETVPFLKNPQIAIENLKAVSLLHQAHERHNGGDCTGRVYAHLWFFFLMPLLKYREKEKFSDSFSQTEVLERIH